MKGKKLKKIQKRKTKFYPLLFGDSVTGKHSSCELVFSKEKKIS